MRFREWLRDGLQRPAGDDAPQPSAELQRLRDVSRELLSAGADAIDRALSADSLEFLAATRQEGGE